MKKTIQITAAVMLFITSCVHAQDSIFLISVPTTQTLVNSIPNDVYITPSSATGPTANGSSTMARTYDKSLTNIYHSTYSGITLPQELVYNFASSVTRIDYLVHYPRTSGFNGSIESVEVWYKLKGETTYTKYGDFDFGGANAPTTVTFNPALENPTSIKFVVKSTAGNTEAEKNKYISCAEMEFYRASDNAFDPSTIFTDVTCSELKPEVTKEDIQNINSIFFQLLASNIKNGYYQSEFRVQDYKAYKTPKTWASENKTAQFGIFDNPTGIYVKNGEILVLLVGETHGASLSLMVKKDTTIDRSSYSLKEGINKITATHDGLCYINYLTATGTEAPVKINIVTGHVNGYFDSEKHTMNDWLRLINAAPHPFFDLKGKYATLNIGTGALKAYATQANGGGKAVIDLYDDVIWKELELEGFVKYNRMPPTRLHFQVYPSGNPNATDYRVAFPMSNQNSLSNPTTSGIKNDPSDHTGGVAWLLAHEAGHVLQVRPGLKWVNMTEVTNNICSQLVTTEWGLLSRLMYEPIGTSNRYNKAITNIINNADPNLNFVSDTDPFCRLVPFWQLYLYMHKTLDSTNFYQDVYEKVRVNPNPTAQYGCTSDAICQMEFVKIACEISGLDLTDFFDAWRFFIVTDVSIEDYSTSRFTLTQQGVDAYKQMIADMHLPKPNIPGGRFLYRIDDSNYELYKPVTP
ncbi:MAG: M60 family metallopeptidase [Candidatus Symbiothrix sp.]|nr:M60 family metallopeptidase [Candidatus Symbiothrix sp.]